MWILTEEFNDYDQHGAYFVDAWRHRPSAEDLKVAGVPDCDIEYVLKGGGRQHNADYQWYILFKHAS